MDLSPVFSLSSVQHGRSAEDLPGALQCHTHSRVRSNFRIYRYPSMSYVLIEKMLACFWAGKR